MTTRVPESMIKSTVKIVAVLPGQNDTFPILLSFPFDGIITQVSGQTNTSTASLDLQIDDGSAADVEYVSAGSNPLSLTTTALTDTPNAEHTFSAGDSLNAILTSATGPDAITVEITIVED